MNASINQHMGMTEWLPLILLSVLWGGSFFFVEIALRELPTLTLVFLRVSLAACALWLVVYLSRRRFPADKNAWIAFFAMGLLNNVIPFSLIVWGQIYIASGLASILNATTPLFTVVIAGLLLTDERITAMKLVGIVFGIAGVTLMVGPSALEGVSSHVLAQLAVLGAAISYAFAGVYGRRFSSMGVDPVVAAAGQVTASSLLLAPAVWILDDPWQLALPGLGTWLAVIGLSLLSTALAYIIYFRILAASGATNLLLVTFLVPVSAILLGVFILAEVLETTHVLGLILIGFGLATIDGRLWKRRTWIAS